MTLAERAASYTAAFPKYPPLVTHGGWIYGVWEIGNNYRGSGFYGSYPPTYLKRVGALFPDAPARPLHLFSGSLDARVTGIRVDRDAMTHPTVQADAQALPFAPGTFELVFADPPYSSADAARYGATMIDRRRVMAGLGLVVKSGGHVVWLDTVKPMYRKDTWRLFGEIMVVRSTNHRVRCVFLFERA